MPCRFSGGARRPYIQRLSGFIDRKVTKVKLRVFCHSRVRGTNSLIYNDCGSPQPQSSRFQRSCGGLHGMGWGCPLCAAVFAIPKILWRPTMKTQSQSGYEPQSSRFQRSCGGKAGGLSPWVAWRRSLRDSKDLVAVITIGRVDRGGLPQSSRFQRSCGGGNGGFQSRVAHGRSLRDSKDLVAERRRVLRHRDSSAAVFAIPKILWRPSSRHP